jgi:hypothetical protein
MFLKMKPYLFLILTSAIYFVFYIIRIAFIGYGSLEALIPKHVCLSLFFIILLIFLYYEGYKNLDKFSFKFIIAGYLIFSFLLIITPTLTSLDLYSYGLRGRIFSIYHQNPYLVPGSAFPQEPFLALSCSSWIDITQAYGPLWTFFSGIITWLGKNSVLLTIYLYKLFIFLGNSLVLLLLYRIAKFCSPEKLKKYFIFMHGALSSSLNLLTMPIMMLGCYYLVCCLYIFI